MATLAMLPNMYAWISYLVISARLLYCDLPNHPLNFRASLPVELFQMYQLAWESQIKLFARRIS